MRPRDSSLAAQLTAGIQVYDHDVRPLPGIRNAARLSTLQEQILESVHRVQFIQVVRARNISNRRADPNDELFDPIKAAILKQREGDVEEAFWLTFLFVHFGKSKQGGWRYAREVYGRLGEGVLWDWESTSRDPARFRAWLDAHQNQLKRSSVPGGFGNHRKYEKLDANSSDGTGAVIQSYVEWVGPSRSHQQLIQEIVARSNGDATSAFDVLYESMRRVRRFGRLARFDYLTMLGKLGLAPIVPGSPYLEGASGPIRGAALLFGTQQSAATFDQWLIELDQHLHVGMQVLEDALCNWQKSPDRFRPFRG